MDLASELIQPLTATVSMRKVQEGPALQVCWPSFVASQVLGPLGECNSLHLAACPRPFTPQI
jgi:hypothetical protein